MTWQLVCLKVKHLHRSLPKVCDVPSTLWTQMAGFIAGLPERQAQTQITMLCIWSYIIFGLNSDITAFSHVKLCGHHMHFHIHTHILLLFLCNWTEICAKTHTHIHIHTSAQTNHSLLAGWPQVRCTQVYQTPACPGTVCCPCPVHLHTSWWSLEKYQSTLISKPRLRKTEELQHCLCKTWRMWVNVTTE